MPVRNLASCVSETTFKKNTCDQNGLSTSTGFPYFYINNHQVSNNTRQTWPQGRPVTLSCQYDHISSPNTKFFEVTSTGPIPISTSYSGQSRLFVNHTVPMSEATGQHTYRCKSTNNVFVQVTIIFQGKWEKMKFLLGVTYITVQFCPPRCMRADYVFYHLGMVSTSNKFLSCILRFQASSYHFYHK